MTTFQRQAPPRSILLPSPTKPTYDLPLQHPYPARYPRESYSAPSSAGYATTSIPNKAVGAASDVPGRRRTSITIEERPRIVVRPLVGTDDSQRRNRRRSSAGSTSSPASPIAQQCPRGPDEASETGGNLVVASVTRKTSTSKAFTNLFRKKKERKDETDASSSSQQDTINKGSLKGKDISLVSLEGEIIEYGRNGIDQTITIKAMRKRALSSSPESRQPAHQAGEKSLRPNFPAVPIRRVSESDVDRHQQNETAESSARIRRPMLTLNMRTQSAIPPRVGSPISMQTPHMSPNMVNSQTYDQYQPRRRSSTRLVSPSASGSARGKSSSRVTSPTSPGFSAFQGFTSPTNTNPQSIGTGLASDFGTGFYSPTSPMSASPAFPSPRQYPSSCVPFSLTIRRESDSTQTSVQQQQQFGSASSRSSTEYRETVGEENMQQEHAFDPAQFEDGSDSEAGGAERRISVSQRTIPTRETNGMRGKQPLSRAPLVDTPSSGPVTPVLNEIPINVISASDSAPLMQRSESGPPPTFKFIPATPIAPENEDDAECVSDDSQRKDGVDSNESKKKKNRNSLPPVPVNPIRPRKLELVLDLNTAPEQVQSTRPTENNFESVQSNTPISALDSLLNDNAFYDPDTNEAFDEDDLASYSRVRSPSRESLLRNTVPLRLSNSPRLVTTTDVCRPVNSSLSMASSCQSSHALTLSTSSTIASSLDSLHTLDLEDVESALGTMLASLSTRPSLASRLALTDPQLAESRDAKLGERAPPPEMELSALGFGEPQPLAYNTMGTAEFDVNSETPTRRDHRRSWTSRTIIEPVKTHASGPAATREACDAEADAEVNDSETDSIFSDIDDLGSVSIAVVHKKSPGLFASPRTVSIEDADSKRSQR